MEIKSSTIDTVLKFTAERDWDQFHSPANLAKSISIEAGELLECFQWDDDQYKENIGHVKEELADVLAYCIDLADKLDFDLDEIILDKMAQNARKYPVEKAKGTAKKYNQLGK